MASQAHDSTRVSIFVEGKYAFGLSRSQALELNLTPGAELPAERLRQITRLAAEEQAYDRVITLLARRAHSRRELLRKLAARGLKGDVAQRAVDRAAASGYVDDARFALEFTRQCRDLRRWAPARVRLELRRRGVADAVIDQALEELFRETDLFALAMQLARARLRSLPSAREARRRSLAAYLARRGFPTAVCRQAVDEVAP